MWSLPSSVSPKLNFATTSNSSITKVKLSHFLGCASGREAFVPVLTWAGNVGRRLELLGNGVWRKMKEWGKSGSYIIHVILWYQITPRHVTRFRIPCRRHHNSITAPHILSTTIPRLLRLVLPKVLLFSYLKSCILGLRYQPPWLHPSNPTPA